MELDIYYKDDAKEADIISMKNQMESRKSIRKANYISKEGALKYWQTEMGDDPVKILGFNPLPNSVELTFNADFVTVDSLENLKKDIDKNIIVRESTYNKTLVENIDRNVNIAGVVLLSLALLMAFVSITLINSTMRLTLYSRRFLIKSMQLVGATQNFIRLPFVRRGLVIGGVSSVVACLMLVTTLSYINGKFPDIAVIQNYLEIGLFLLGLMALGIIITALSSYFAINKYLAMKLDDLF